MGPRPNPNPDAAGAVHSVVSGAVGLYINIIWGTDALFYSMINVIHIIDVHVH